MVTYPFLIISVGILREFAMCVHFTVPSGRRAHLAAHSSKRFKPFSATLLLCLGNTSKEQDCKSVL